MLRIVATLMLMLLLPAPSVVGAEEPIAATLYKRPHCSCCDGHADHLRKNGYKITVIQTKNLAGIKQKYGVPQEFEGCHTIVIGDYVVEGHVPASIIGKMLKERPAIRGISLPGMPDGSPGMNGSKKGPFVVHEFSKKGSRVFATE